MSPINGFPPPPYTSVGQPMFRTLSVAASGLSAQRARLEVISTNIANADTTRTATGGPYRRQVVQMQAAGVPALPYELSSVGQPFMRLPSGQPIAPAEGVEVTGVVEDPSQGPLVYDPGHPDADANGYVRYPNVRITDELVDLMDARRVYEANATVFQSAKAMLRSSLDI
ncbi:MAG TPA: flagellar basal body rod protein FlgC [Longimicrobiaceae bacterium]|nr:flagellar basal body rod protein FlgC [Longimicrobiaceae bacterium]